MDICKPTRDEGCGCIGHYAHIFGSKMGIEDSAAVGFYGQRFLAINSREASRLVFIDEWPAKFRKYYKRSKAKAAIARINHFIKTNGAE